MLIMGAVPVVRDSLRDFQKNEWLARSTKKKITTQTMLVLLQRPRLVGPSLTRKTAKWPLTTVLRRLGEDIWLQWNAMLVFDKEYLGHTPKKRNYYIVTFKLEYHEWNNEVMYFWGEKSCLPYFKGFHVFEKKKRSCAFLRRVIF